MRSASRELQLGFSRGKEGRQGRGGLGIPAFRVCASGLEPAAGVSAIKKDILYCKAKSKFN